MSASAVESLLRGAGYTSVRPLPLPFSCEFSLPQAKYTEAEYVEWNVNSQAAGGQSNWQKHVCVTLLYCRAAPVD